MKAVVVERPHQVCYREVAAPASRVVGLISDRVLELGRIVTHRFPAAEFQEAVRLMDDSQGIVAKIVLEHS